MKSRNYTSLTIAFAFIAIAITGLSLYFGVKSEAIETIHVLFGWIFTGFAIAHIWFNFKSIRNYSKDRKTKLAKKELIISSSVSVVLIIAMCLGFAFTDQLAHAGRNLFSGKGGDRDHNRKSIPFSQVRTNDTVKGRALHFIIHENSRLVAPVIAIWAEHPGEEYYENLFVPSQVLNVPGSVNDVHDLDRPAIKKELTYTAFDAQAFPEYKQRNAALPANFKGISPLTSFFLDTNTTIKGNFMIYIEIRHRGKTELYHATVDSTAGNLFMFSSTASQFLTEAFVRVG